MRTRIKACVASRTWSGCKRRLVGFVSVYVRACVTTCSHNSALDRHTPVWLPESPAGWPPLPVSSAPECLPASSSRSMLGSRWSSPGWCLSIKHSKCNVGVAASRNTLLRHDVCRHIVPAGRTDFKSHACGEKDPFPAMTATWFLNYTEGFLSATVYGSPSTNLSAVTGNRRFQGD